MQPAADRNVAATPSMNATARQPSLSDKSNQPPSLLPSTAAAATTTANNQTGAARTSRLTARRAELSRKAAETPSTASAARTRSLADFLVPGMLDLSIAKALMVLSDVCYRLQESQVLAQRLYNRMLFLRGEVENKALGTRIQSDVILRYGEQVGKAIQFVRQYQSKTLLARIAANRRFLDGLRELHARLDHFFTKVGLASRVEMHEWRDHWASDLALQQQLLASFVSNRRVMIAELTERGAEEALMEILAEFAKPQKTKSHVALMTSVVERIRFEYARLLSLPVLQWLLARNEAQYKQEPLTSNSYHLTSKASGGSTYSGHPHSTFGSGEIDSIVTELNRIELDRALAVATPKCPKCSASTVSDHHFCGECGYHLDVDIAADAAQWPRGAGEHSNGKAVEIRVTAYNGHPDAVFTLAEIDAIVAELTRVELDRAIEAATPKCTECIASTASGHRFCGECGSRLAVVTTAAA